MSVRVSLRGMPRLIRVGSLRRVHNVGFLLERIICTCSVFVCMAFYAADNNGICTCSLSLFIWYYTPLLAMVFVHADKNMDM